MSWAKNALIEEVKGLSIKFVNYYYFKKTIECKNCGAYKHKEAYKTLTLKDFLFQLNKEDIYSYSIRTEMNRKNVLNLKLNGNYAIDYFIYLEDKK